MNDPLEQFTQSLTAIDELAFDKNDFAKARAIICAMLKSLADKITQIDSYDRITKQSDCQTIRLAGCRLRGPRDPIVGNRRRTKSEKVE